MRVGVGLGAGVALLAPASAQATDFTVTTLAGGPTASAGSLRKAVQDANAHAGADRIVFQSGLSGTISLSAGGPTITDPTQIVGPGASVLTIDGNSTRDGFISDPGVGETVSISGLTIANTQDGFFDGAGITAVSGSLSVSGMNFTASKAAGVGGAISATNDVSDVAVADSQFSLNTAGTYGGALYISNNLAITNSSFNANSSKSGGAVAGFGSSLTISGSSFTQNTATQFSAGAVYGNNSNSTVISGSTFVGNTGASAGAISVINRTNAVVTGTRVSQNTATGSFGIGGMLVGGGRSVVVDSSTFDGNRALGGPVGGLTLNSAANRLQNSTVTGNSAATLAGGIQIYQGIDPGTGAIDSSTISGNTAGTAGGGVYAARRVAAYPALAVRNTILAGNTAPTGAEILSAGPAPTPTDVANSLVQGSTGGAGITESGPVITGQDPGLSALADNGGLTPTQALALTSPAVNAGATALTTDQRGEARPFGGAPDIGAYELQQAPPPVPKPKCAGKTATIVATKAKTKGTKRADVIVGRKGADKIFGLGGNDTICGLGGNDRLYGGKGKDRLIGAAGRDKLFGGPGRDKLNGGPGKDTQKQ